MDLIKYFYNMVFYKNIILNNDTLRKKIKNRDFYKIEDWDVGNVDDMSNLFKDNKNFNHDISKWNVSNVVNMENMFYGCIKFNCDLDNWNVGKVKNMRYMFFNCIEFINNNNIDNWDINVGANTENIFLVEGV